MTIVVERAVLVRVTLEAPTLDDADTAFESLRDRIDFSIPKRRLGFCEIRQRTVTLWRNVGQTKTAVKLWQ